MSEGGVSRKIFFQRAGGVVLSATSADALFSAGTATAARSKIVKFHGSLGGVQYPTTTASVPTIVGQEKGFFKAQGLTLDNVLIQSSLDIARALQQGQLDFANGGILPVMGGFAAGLTAPRLIGLAEQAQGLIWIAKSDSGIKSVTDLKGKNVGLIGSAQNITFFMIQQALQGVGLSTNDVRFTYFTSLPASQAAVMNGVVDCSITNKPPGLIPVQQKQAVVVFDAGVLNLASDGLWTTADFARKHPQVCRQFITAFAQAQQWVRHNPDAAVTLWAKATKVDRALLRLSIQGPMLKGYTISFTQDMFAALDTVGVALGQVQPSLGYGSVVIPTFQAGLTKYGK